MKLNSSIKEADFKISDTVEIRYKKGYGFWILKKRRGQLGDIWYAFLNNFHTIALGIGFKEQYGFGFKDLKPMFFKTFDDAINALDKVDSSDYWEYNKETHEKVFDTILKKGAFLNSIIDII